MAPGLHRAGVRAAVSASGRGQSARVHRRIRPCRIACTAVRPRDRNDRHFPAFIASQGKADMRINGPFAIIALLILVCAVLALMSRARAGDEQAGASAGETTGTSAYRQLDAERVRVPRVPDENVARRIRLRERQTPPSTRAISQ